MSIPVSNYVKVTPSVLSAGGRGLVLNGMILSQYALLPFGAPLAFPNALAVANYFGPNSVEAGLAATYFTGYTIGTLTPSSMLFSRFAASAISAFLRGGKLTSTLAGLQAIRPCAATASIAGTTLTTTVVPAGTLMTPGMLLTGTGVTAGTRVVSQLTGPVGGVGTYTVSASQTVASTTITGAYDLTVTIDGVAATAATIDLHSAASFSAMATAIGTALSLSGGQTCTYSSQSGGFIVTSGTTGAASTITVATGLACTLLALTAATGAIASQGSALQTPGAAMDAIVGFTQNWAGFTTTIEPSNADKMLFANWTSAQNGEYAYICYDSDTTAASSANSTICFGYLLTQSGNSGTTLIGASAAMQTAYPLNLPRVAAFVLGTMASLDFERLNSRLTFAYKTNSTISPTCDNFTDAANLEGNGYNYYGAVASANDNFIFFFPGSVSGPYGFLDAYVDALWLNSEIQLALIVGFTNTPSVPYNNAGYTLVKAWASDPIKRAVTYGAIRKGVQLSSAQITEVNQAAGVDISQTLFAQGWYFQVSPASPSQRAIRASPACTLWYTDGGSVQRLNVASVDIQ